MKAKSKKYQKILSELDAEDIILKVLSSKSIKDKTPNHITKKIIDQLVEKGLTFVYEDSIMIVK